MSVLSLFPLALGPPVMADVNSIMKLLLFLDF